MKTIFFRATCLAVVAVLLVQCCKDTGRPSDTDLQNADLATIQAALAGRWELKRISGGLCNFCEHPVAHRPYMVLTNASVTFGNDSLGVVEQGPLTWARADNFGNAYAFTGPSGNGYVPLDIRNDTLRLHQYAFDGVIYHYTRPD
ncbi:MAG: hypothetical protein EOO08_10230 [Chitinophagaceae bacterium]|nr:MAG: hypothetical protein EOO08_10230 [Chitinophagaceae bacterium]